MPTFCLIHGSGQSPEGWKLLVHELEQRGHSVLTPAFHLDRTDEGAAWHAIPWLRRSRVQATSQRTLFVSHTPRVGCISRWLPSAGYHVEWYSWLRWFRVLVLASLTSIGLILRCSIPPGSGKILWMIKSRWSLCFTTAHRVASNGHSRRAFISTRNER